MKKMLTAVGSVAVLALALTSCTGGDTPSDEPDSSSQEHVDLTWWTWWGTAQDMADKYNASQDRVTVTVENVGGGTEQFTKLNQAVRAGEGPDLALAEYQWLPSYLTAGVAEDISEYVDGVKGEYNPAIWNLVQLGDGVYGVPLDQAPMLYIYRADLFEKYGLDVPTTWDEFADLAAKVRTIDPEMYLSTMPAQDAGWFAGLSAQAGAQWFAQKDGVWDVTIAGGKADEVADYWDGLVKDDLVLTDQYQTTEFNTRMASGQLLSLPTGSWFATGMSVFNGAPDTVGTWAIAPLPTWEKGDKVSFQGGSAALVTTVSEHPKEAAEFLTWLGSQEDGQRAMIEAGGNFPASNPGLDVYASIPLSDQRAAYKQEDFHEILTEIAGNTLEITWAPNTTIAFSNYVDEIGRAITAGTSFRDALSKTQDAVIADLESSGFDVK
ncbi:ABC transporter substrate-binding protein [Microbacterium oxydans]|uniref:ABC transporter substrate-binding protein n=1 Tax=Microbacterium oxydans TaxID=82380 RepID=UPI00226B7552|nr:sugar ABC transporter substrate-binding protein [Microbacterium oxydans]WAA66233.1 sugar ABC transporter substrate-binding protein [Microbacterium oxydans]